MALTRDAFLGGRVTVLQPKSGYRAGPDPVLLAAACPAKPGDTVLELGCGVGVASLCLAARVGDLTILGVERDADTADLARRNAVGSAARDFQVVTADLTDLPRDIRDRSFDHVLANPPYFAAGTRAEDAARAAARHEQTPLEDWIAVAGRRLKPKGALTMILSADRLPEALSTLRQSFGGIAIRPIAARPKRMAGRVLICATKGSRAPFRLLAPLIMHAGHDHLEDRDDHSDCANGILRSGDAIRWQDG